MDSEGGPVIRPQVSRLTNALDVLDQYGGKSNEDKDFHEWFNERCDDSDVDRLRNISTATDFTKMHMFLSDLHKVKNLLGTAVEDITVICGHIQSLYEAALQSARTSILSLPPEILTMIFKEIKDDPESIKNLMLTCRRFRDFAIQVPALWCTIRSTDTPAHWKRCLERSLKYELIIRIIKPQEKKHEIYSWLPKEFCELISMECERWKELYIELGSSGDSRFTGHGCFKRLFLPKLTTLSLEYCSYSTQPILVEIMTRNWTAPNLKCFQGLPVECLGKFTDTLTDCGFILDSRSLHSISPLLQSLFQRMAGCRIMKFSLFTDGGPNDGNGTLPSMEPAFPGLQALWLAFPPHNGNGNTVEHLLTNIIPVAQITELTLEIFEGRYRSIYYRYTLGSFTKAAAWEYDSLRVLNLKMGHVDDYKYTLISSRMPNLEHISICSFDGGEPTERFSDIQCCGNLPLGLRTVTFRDCPDLRHEYLIDMAQVLCSAAFAETFEKLEIVDCPLSQDTRTKLIILLQGKFARTYSIPKIQQSTNLYQARVDYDVGLHQPH